VTIDWKTIQPITDTAGCVDACNGWDFDLIVKLPDGTSVDPVNDKGSLAAAPFVNAPRDSYGDYSPVEGVVIGIQAANGTYKVVADKWPDPAGSDFNPSWSGSQASVQMYNGDTSIGRGPRQERLFLHLHQQERMHQHRAVGRECPGGAPGQLPAAEALSKQAFC
jgi:hypothetical protein